MALEIKVERGGEVAIVKCAGRLVSGSAVVQLREKMRLLLSECSEVVVDLEHTTYIDSGGLGMLIFVHHFAERLGSSLRLVNLNGRVLELFEMTRLLDFFGVADQRQTAAVAAAIE